ncbi:MAG: hypothetical protein K0U64_08120 [Actinomycetia bacterium]|nr:hypothetical protein [Actinomycetes bacterium]
MSRTENLQVTTPYLLSVAGFFTPYSYDMESIVWFVTPILVTTIAAGILWLRDRRRSARHHKANRQAALHRVGEVLAGLPPSEDSSSARTLDADAQSDSPNMAQPR